MGKGRLWQTWEIDKIKELIKTKNTKEIAAILNRTVLSVNRKLKDLGLVNLNEDYLHWTDEEVETLKELIKTKSLKQIASEMNRKQASIKKKVKSLGLSFVKYDRDVWNEDDVKRLKELIPNYKVSEIADMLDRSPRAIRKKLERLNIEIPNNTYTYWTDDEVKTLRELAPNHTVNEIASKMGRTTNSIRNKLELLQIDYVSGKSDLSEDQIKYIKDNYLTSFNVDIARDLNISAVSVVKYAKKYGLSKAHERWTEEEVNKLKEYALTHDINEIAEHYELDLDYIIELSNKYDFKVIKPEKIVQANWNDEEVEYLTNSWGKEPLFEIVKKLNKSRRVVIYKAKCLGLDSYKELSDSLIRVYDVSQLLCINDKTILITWAKLGLNIKSVQTTKYQSYRYVDYEELLSFLFNHQELWDASKIEEEYLEDLPDWINIKAEEDRINHLNITLETNRALAKVRK